MIKKEGYKSHKLCTESSKSELARVYIINKRHRIVLFQHHPTHNKRIKIWARCPKHLLTYILKLPMVDFTKTMWSEGFDKLTPHIRILCFI